MDRSSAAFADPVEDAVPPALLRGTQRGLEMLVNGRADLDAITRALLAKLEEAPGFFRGSDVRVSVEDGPLAAGCLGRLDEIAARFELRIIEVGAAQPVPRPNLAGGSSPTPATATAPGLVDGEADTVAALAELPRFDDLADEIFEEPTQTAVPVRVAELVGAVRAPETLRGPRLVIGPVRSGVILDHEGHVIVFGDVNPGAEVRATGNIIVLGRLRGTAHAGIGQDSGFILALRLEPQQLRIGRMVARAADSDTPASDAEIAHITSGGILVEPYVGKLPRNLATSI
jgi:septum formation inhibitor MinC